uniref:serine/arginine repetitive matrix protein 1 isoform X2 n=1 Tax=Fragaria vesca subsp. vesca TaxID=101020 RepID=UPI0005C99555|nr:PREDICTED: serine/arginine repetitive matrix protein 1 isoform X2 [Fragaria vesca subsp. vesca]
MSGGFFRGTSADQDTRFSNKQAKLMKSQKFAPELEHLVDMTKVNMDVMRPWIATRVTELLGFEDEVLINFIYGLLDVKEANGKEIQISLTGFMEKNTVKFMKELWTHLLSAQNNASGVPQQFLDAKQEEARKKKEEADAIETQRKKDKEVLELERSKKMEGGVDKKPSNGEAGPSSYRVSPRASSDRPDDERGTGNRNGVTARNRVSRSPLPPIDSADSDSSLSPRFGERDGSSSVSKSPEARGRSISSERGRGYRSPQRRPISSRRRSPEGSLSPRGRSPHSRRGSRSNSPHRSRSPVLRRVRSPYQRRSRSPGRRRSPPPFRSRRSPSPFRGRRSPYRRRRSPSPLRRRRPSPVRNRRSPSPIRRRRSPSPLRRRLSPIGRRRRSPSPARRRSPSPVRPSYRRSSRNRYASPVRRRSPVRSGRRSPPLRRRSPSPSDRSSSSPVQRDSPSPVKRTTTQKRSPLQSHQERTRSVENLSPASQQSSGSEGSLQRESKNGNNYHKRVPALSPSPQKSPLNLEPSPGARSLREKRRLSSPSESPAKRPKEQIARYGSSSPSRKPREQKLRRDSPKECEEEDDADHRPKSLERRSRDTSGISKQIISPAKIPNKEEYSPERVVSGQRFTESQSHLDKIESRNQEQEMKSGKSSGRGSNMPIVYKDSLPGETQRASNPGEGKKADDKNRSHSKNTKDSERHRKPGSLHSSVEMVDHSNHSGGLDSGSEDSDKGRSGDKEKRKNKRSEKQEVTSDDDDSYDSAIEDRKEAKKRRKEEKRLRKEKKRRRREERRRRREERRAEKQKVKNSSDASGSDGEHVTGRGFHSSDNEEEAVQKKLEIELRKKALESLKAKKGISQ